MGKTSVSIHKIAINKYFQCRGFFVRAHYGPEKLHGASLYLRQRKQRRHPTFSIDQFRWNEYKTCGYRKMNISTIGFSSKLKNFAFSLIVKIWGGVQFLGNQKLTYFCSGKRNFSACFNKFWYKKSIQNEWNIFRWSENGNFQYDCHGYRKS